MSILFDKDEQDDHEADLEHKRGLVRNTNVVVMPGVAGTNGLLWRDSRLTRAEESFRCELERRGRWNCRAADEFVLSLNGNSTTRSALIKDNLRKKGWRIDTDESLQPNEYIFVGPPVRNLVKVLQGLKDAYYRTPHWRGIANERRRMDSHRCVMCHGTAPQLDVHHWQYNFFNESVMRDVVTLCGPFDDETTCHHMIHQRISKSGVHWPRYVDIELARRIAEEAQ